MSVRTRNEETFPFKEFEGYLKIDRDNLDDALLTQADIFYKISNEYALAVSRRDQAYDDIKSTDANLNLELREQFEKAGEKFTEAKLTAAVLAHREHDEATNKHRVEKQRADLLGALKEAFSQKSYMLKELTQLYIAGYFAETSATADAHTASEIQYDKNKKKMKQDRKGEYEKVKTRKRIKRGVA